MYNLREKNSIVYTLDKGRSSHFKSGGGGGQLSGDVTPKGKLIMHIMYQVHSCSYNKL